MREGTPQALMPVPCAPPPERCPPPHGAPTGSHVSASMSCPGRGLLLPQTQIRLLIKLTPFPRLCRRALHKGVNRAGPCAPSPRVGAGPEGAGGGLPRGFRGLPTRLVSRPWPRFTPPPFSVFLLCSPPPPLPPPSPPRTPASAPTSHPGPRLLARWGGPGGPWAGATTRNWCSAAPVPEVPRGGVGGRASSGARGGSFCLFRLRGWPAVLLCGASRHPSVFHRHVVSSRGLLVRGQSWWVRVHPAPLWPPLGRFHSQVPGGPSQPGPASCTLCRGRLCFARHLHSWGLEPAGGGRHVPEWPRAPWELGAAASGCRESCLPAFGLEPGTAGPQSVLCGQMSEPGNCPPDNPPMCGWSPGKTPPCRASDWGAQCLSCGVSASPLLFAKYGMEVGSFIY